MQLAVVIDISQGNLHLDIDLMDGLELRKSEQKVADL